MLTTRLYEAFVHHLVSTFLGSKQEGQFMRRQRWVSIVGSVALALTLVGMLLPTLSQTTLRAFAQQATPEASPVASPEASPVASPEASPVEAPVALTDAPVFASGRWRITLTYAVRAAEVPELALPARNGRDWIVVIADVANWSGKRATFKPSEFGVRAAGVEKASGFSKQQSEAAAKTLALQPTDVDKGVGISSGKSVRFVIVFRFDNTGADPVLAYDNDEITLAGALARGGTLIALPGVEALPDLQEASVDSVPDGGSLELNGQTVKLAGVDAPAGNDCFASQASRRLERLAGDNVLVETSADSDSAYIWVQDEGGLRTLINHAVIAAGSAAASTDAPEPYSEWLRTADADARQNVTGLWASCTGQHGVARDQKPEVTSLVVHSDGKDRKYEVWVAWSPLIVTKPDGSAWAFFSAETKDGNDAGDKRLWASYFDPKTGKWGAATAAFKGGAVQMGPAAVVDQDGRVNIVYANRTEDADGVFSEIFYAKEDGKGGWTTPVPVSREASSGYQLSPSMAIDDTGVMHVAWQDQRAFSEDARAASPSNADIFVSDLKPGGTWQKPVLISTHYTDGASSRPHIVADGDRLVAVWSVYATSLGLNAAIRVDWSTRPLDDELAWTAPDPLVVGRGESFGGRLLDLAADPTGGVVLVYGRQATDTFLFLRRLKPDATEWGGDTLLTYGDRGTFPSVTVSDQGVVYVVYNAGAGNSVDVGAVAIPYRSIQPGPEVILTTDQPNTQGRPIVATDITGRPWIIYFSEPGDGVANETRVLRNADIPTTAK